MLETQSPMESLPYGAALCVSAHEAWADNDRERAIATYAEVADFALKMIWWQLMTSGESADVRPIRKMQQLLRPYKV